MNPIQLTEKLRRLASAIESDPNPSKAKVVRALSGLKVKVAGNSIVENKRQVADHVHYAPNLGGRVDKIDTDMNPDGSYVLTVYVTDEDDGSGNYDAWGSIQIKYGADHAFIKATYEPFRFLGDGQSYGSLEDALTSLYKANGFDEF